MRLPRTCRISASVLRARSSFSNQICPPTICAAGGSTRRMLSASVLLPDPDSPTMPIVSPATDAQRHVIHRTHHAGPLRGDVMRGEVVDLQQRPAGHDRRFATQIQS